MCMRTLGFVCVLIVFGAGCPSDDGGAAAESSTGRQTGTADGGPSSSSDPSTSTTPTSTSTPMTSTSTGTTSSNDSSSEGSSSSGGCEPGTVDCECDNGACQAGLDCVLDVCTDPNACKAQVDTEPNDDELTAFGLPELECDVPVASVAGSVDGFDTDWFTYHAVDNGACTVASTAAIVTPDLGNLDVCMYFECDMGIAIVSCGPGSSEATSPEGRPGCCAEDNVSFTTNNCMGAGQETNGDIYIEVQTPPIQQCVNYDIAYRYAAD